MIIIMSEWKCVKCGNTEFEKEQFQATGGVVGIRERLEDAKVRDKDKTLSVWSNEQKAN